MELNQLNKKNGLIIKIFMKLKEILKLFLGKLPMVMKLFSITILNEFYHLVEFNDAYVFIIMNIIK